MKLHDWELTLNLRAIGYILWIFLLFTSALFGAICFVLLFLGTVVFADGRTPDELNHGVAVYHVDSINEYFSDGNTCAKWINNASELEVVKHPLVMNEAVCADWTYYQVVAGLEPVE